MKFLLIVLLPALVSFSIAAQEIKKKDAKVSSVKEYSDDQVLELINKFNKYKDIIATVDTSLGSFKFRLYGNKAPITVETFIGLAEGTEYFLDKENKKEVMRPFYDGLAFDRVAPNFLIQGGCPEGNRRGGPGFTYKNEIDDSLKFDSKGIVAMANADKNKNGSQFFITLAPAKFINGQYTIFGKITEGMDVVEKIGKLKTFPNEKPIKKVTINTISIERVPWK